MRNIFFKLVLPVAALVAGGYVARHAFSEGIHIVIAAQPGSPKYDSPRATLWDGPCSLDSHLQYKNAAQCEMEKRANQGENPLVFHAEPPQGMTKEQSETASGWFLLAVFAIPLSLGAAALLGLLLFHAVRAE
jgi:hypothetical protein